MNTAEVEPINLKNSTQVFPTAFIRSRPVVPPQIKKRNTFQNKLLYFSNLLFLCTLDFTIYKQGKHYSMQLVSYCCCCDIFHESTSTTKTILNAHQETETSRTSHY